MSDCTYERIDASRIRCTTCGKERSWTSDGPPPRRNCPAAKTTPPPREYGLGCIHRGAAIGTQGCRQCGRKGDSVTVFTCAIYGKCVESAFDGPTGMRKEGFGYCFTCPDIKTDDDPQTILFQFDKGLGDYFTFQTVLRHIQALRPNWTVDVECKLPRAGLFAGLCREVRELLIVGKPNLRDQASGGREAPGDQSAPHQNRGADAPRSPGEYDRIFPIGKGGYPIGRTVFRDAPGTAAEQFLKAELGIEPRAELCGYAWNDQFPSTNDQRITNHEGANVSGLSVASSIRHSVPGHSLGFGYLGLGHSPYVVVHHQGLSYKHDKNLPADDLRPTVEWLLAEGYRVLVLDMKGRSDLARVRAAGFAPTMLAEGPWVHDVRELVRLCAGAALNIGIDSGPGHAAAASGAPTVIITYGKHPYHCFQPSPNVLHLMATGGDELLRGDVPTGRAAFERLYRHRVAGGRERLADALLHAAREVLDVGIEAADRRTLVIEGGIARQRDRSRPVEYGDAYFAKYEAYRGTEIARRINAARVDLVRRHLCPPSPLAGEGPGVRVPAILDVGIGSGEFLEAWDAAVGGGGYGFDVNPRAVEWLKERGRFYPLTPDPSTARTAGRPSQVAEGRGEKLADDVAAFTLWDTLEHLPEPADLLRRVKPGQFVFLSLPICEDLHAIHDWKHYWPNEHLWYFTHDGLVDFMGGLGFMLTEANDFETAAGRQDIRSYAFRRAVPGEGVLITGGLGDFLAVESLLTHAQRDRIGRFILATRADKPIRALLAAHPRYRDLPVESVPIVAGGPDRYHWIAEVEAATGRKLPDYVADLSIAAVFGRRPAGYTGSSFLQPGVCLADTKRFGLQERPYWVIQPTSPNERETPPRDFDAADWAVVLDLLSERGCVGVVLGVGDDPIPDDRRLVDLTNLTTVPESLEILKGASGFAGCASALSVPAAQLFAAENLRIKGSNPHLWKHRRQYYAPHTSFPFVVRRIER